MNDVSTNMRNSAIVALIIVIIIVGFFWRDISHPFTNHIESTAMQQSTSSSVDTLIVKSSAFENGEAIPQKYSCVGENTNPPLTIQDVDAQAKSLAIILDDPDAPNGTFTHWVKFNIPPETQIIEEGKEPQGVAGKNSAGKLTFIGPCPPSGTHRYFFKVFALDSMLDLPEGVSKADLEKRMDGHILQQAELMGTFSKQ